MPEKIVNNSAGKATAPDVFRAFWKGIAPNKASFFFDMATLAGVSIIQIITPLFYRRFFDTITKAEDKAAAAPELMRLILFILLFNALAWLFFRTGTFIHNHFQSNVIARLKQQAYRHLMDHSYSFFTNNFTGSLVQRVNRFARAFERLTDRLVWNMIPLTVSIAGVSVVLWWTSPIITGVIVFWAAAFVAFNYFFSKWKLKYNLQSAEADSESTGVLSDTITNHNNIQLFTGTAHENENYAAATDKQAKISRFVWNLNGIVDAVQASLIFIVEFLLFYFAIKYWQRGLITVGTFVLIQFYFFDLTMRLWDFSRIVRDVYDGFADAKEMVDIMLLPHEIKDLPDTADLRITDGTVEFRNVSFSFNETREVLKNINLVIHGGEKVALIGPSGAGKSTFIRLILRLYDVASGAVLIDGQDIKHATLDSLRRNASLVPQDPILFHRSLKENIRYGRRDATDDEVIEAGRLAHCDEFVKNLPGGYDTYVGERGIKLSGGERQRVAIARAILKNAPILILDEATSSLDSGSEALIQDALEKLMKNKTVIVIAHRLSTIRKMDRIIVIDGGKITEEGTHDGLLSNNESLYRKLWDLQAGGFLKEAGSAQGIEG